MGQSSGEFTYSPGVGGNLGISRKYVIHRLRIEEILVESCDGKMVVSHERGYVKNEVAFLCFVHIA